MNNVSAFSKLHSDQKDNKNEFNVFIKLVKNDFEDTWKTYVLNESINFFQSCSFSLKLFYFRSNILKIWQHTFRWCNFF